MWILDLASRLCHGILGILNPVTPFCHRILWMLDPFLLMAHVWHLHIQIGTILFRLFANSIQMAGPIGMGEALIDVFRHRKDDGAY